MKLVIVESPAKCDTIKRYLGSDYQIMASLGHVRDLATTGKGGLGVDIDNGFKPTYVIDKSKYKVVKSLQAAAAQADEVILATDPDREGEAIAWHLSKVLNLDVEKTKRLEFHEITRDSITKAINQTRTIDLNLVDSQEVRRILDRIIGFKLSSLLNKKIHSVSAGRVQSATLKIINEHQKEIDAFIPEPYYKFNVSALFQGKTYNLTIKLNKDQEIKSDEDAQKIIDSLPGQLEVVDIKVDRKTRLPKEPFTTSTLQQAAYNKFKYRTKKTQSIAQTLYEGFAIGDNEHVGLITYMRTDSTRLSSTFIARARAYIEERFGKDYVATVAKNIKGNANEENVQDAHEAIRPTGNHRTPESIAQYLTKDQYDIYKLIYDRAVASLMKPKVEDITTITLKGNNITFTLEGSTTIFPGFEALYKDEEAENLKAAPSVSLGDVFKIKNKDFEKKYTTPPANYTEAKLVKIMEEVGIGRPSTYASTIAILQKRKYVTDTGGVLQITDQGRTTSEALDDYFSDIINTEYTALMESQLDRIASGEVKALDILNNFYKPFIKDYEIAQNELEKVQHKGTGELCPICGSELVYKDGKNGQFIGCSNFPKCRYIKKEQKPEEELKYTGENCPDCGKPLIIRKDRKGREFIGCSGFPNCHYIKVEQKENAKPTKENEVVGTCPKCGNNLIKKKGKYSYFIGCSNFPKCNYMEKIKRKK